MKLPENECPKFFQFYVNDVQEDVLSALKDQLNHYVQFIKNIPEEKQLFKYREDKWTIKEVVGHNTDTERLKSAAALRISRNDPALIPGFEEKDYVSATHFNVRSMDQLLNEFAAVRTSTIALLESLKAEERQRIGIVSSKQVSARALFYFMVGHVAHHEKILRERYLKEIEK